MRELFLIVFCIILYGSATFFKRLGLGELHPYQFLLITAICYFLLTPIWFWLIKIQSTQTSYTTEGVIYSIIYSFFSISGGLILAFLLKNTRNPGTLIIMVNLSSIITLFLSYVFLHEHLSTTKLLAITLAIISLILVNY